MNVLPWRSLQQAGVAGRRLRPSPPDHGVLLPSQAFALPLLAGPSWSAYLCVAAWRFLEPELARRAPCGALQTLSAAQQQFASQPLLSHELWV